jgi:hypothetical protein
MENNNMTDLFEENEKFLDGWYKLSSTNRNERENYTRKIKASRQLVMSVTATERRSQLAAKLTNAILSECLPEPAFENVVENLYPMLRMIIQKLLDKHKIDVIPEGARYWLPHEGETVYILRERDDGTTFVDEVLFNIFDLELQNFLALGNVIFMTREEAMAAVTVEDD